MSSLTKGLTSNISCEECDIVVNNDTISKQNFVDLDEEDHKSDTRAGEVTGHNRTTTEEEEGEYLKNVKQSFKRKLLIHNLEGKTLDEVVCKEDNVDNSGLVGTNFGAKIHCLKLKSKEGTLNSDDDLKKIDQLVQSLEYRTFMFNRLLIDTFNLKIQILGDNCYILNDSMENISLSSTYERFVKGLHDLKKSFQNTPSDNNLYYSYINGLWHSLTEYIHEFQHICNMKADNLIFQSRLEPFFELHTPNDKKNIYDLVFKELIVNYMERMRIHSNIEFPN